MDDPDTFDDETWIDALRSLGPLEPPPGSRDRFLERLAAERLAAERLAAERLAAERLDAEHPDAERPDAEHPEDQPGFAAGGQLRTRLARWTVPLAVAAAAAFWLILPDPIDPRPAVPGVGARLEAPDADVLPSGVVALLEGRLMDDPSAATRVRSVDALANLAPAEPVAAILVRAIETDSSPFVQAAILTASREFGAETRARLAHVLLTREGIDSLLLNEASALAFGQPVRSNPAPDTQTGQSL